MKKKVVLLLLLILATVLKTQVILANNMEKVKIEIQTSKAQGTTKFQAKDVNVLFEKMKRGSFTDDDFNDVALETLKKNDGIKVNKKEKNVTVTDFSGSTVFQSITFGKGKRLSEEETRTVMKTLFMTQRVYFDVLNQGDNTITTDLSIDARWKAKGELAKEHWYILMDYSGKIPLQFFYTQKDVVFNFSKDERSEIKLEKISGVSDSKDAKIKENEYAIGYGQKATFAYVLKIPQGVKKISISFSSTYNFEIDPNSFQLEGENLKVTREDNWTNDNPYSSKEKSLETALKEFQEQLVEYNIPFYKGYNLELPYSFLSKKEVRISFSATLHKEENYSLPLIYMADGVKYKKNEQIASKAGKTMMSTVYADTLIEDQNSNISNSKVSSATLIARGANFFVSDVNTGKPLANTAFALFRVDKTGKVEVVEKKTVKEDYIWQVIPDFQLKNLKGNEELNREEIAKAIEKKETAIAEFEPGKEGALVISGLSTKYVYFLYQTKFQDGYEKKQDIYTFTVSKTSYQNAPRVSFTNSDYWPRTDSFEEYNAIINVKKGQKQAQSFSDKQPKVYLILCLSIAIVFAVSLLAVITLKT
ncbi:hypothetical protein SAMN02745116_01646 [Pilibacter termitis]|uniref:Uncharacterized protein n=1 Tax=Pilibacter termitis TaxID=263852 RepID=A0A1T4P4E9_9ENTE|nr:SpaA isopeptide-forming pilin-related protein [Pilibacter termitis]SJZ86302.1 hypothetical protein SAMN02745116_01646 [Pilibacter termitis]